MILLSCIEFLMPVRPLITATILRYCLLDYNVLLIIFSVNVMQAKTNSITNMQYSILNTFYLEKCNGFSTKFQDLFYNYTQSKTNCITNFHNWAPVSSSQEAECVRNEYLRTYYYLGGKWCILYLPGYNTTNKKNKGLHDLLCILWCHTVWLWCNISHWFFLYPFMPTSTLRNISSTPL